MLRKFKNKQTGVIVEACGNWRANTYWFKPPGSHSTLYVPDILIEGSSDWEEITDEPKTDYQVLEVTRRNVVILAPQIYDLNKYFNQGYVITKVRRLSDNQVFSVGDNISTDNSSYPMITISGFRIINNPANEVVGRYCDCKAGTMGILASYSKNCLCILNGIQHIKSEPKKDYEILSIHCNGDVSTKDRWESFETQLKNMPHFSIHSVKRLSDGSKDDA